MKLKAGTPECSACASPRLVSANATNSRIHRTSAAKGRLLGADALGGIRTGIDLLAEHGEVVVAEALNIAAMKEKAIASAREAFGQFAA